MTKQKTFIVVDSNDHWLHFGHEDTPQEAYENSKEADEFDTEAEVTVYEVKSETRFEGKPDEDFVKECEDEEKRKEKKRKEKVKFT